jgi:uncharacterized cupin superfamily protein
MIVTAAAVGRDTEDTLNREISEASLAPAEGDALAPQGDGWFIVNVAETQAGDNEVFGARSRFEGDSPFQQFGINVHIVRPGQPASFYHREDAQEAFLVLSGECLAVVEGRERGMRAGDLLYAPPGTAHVLIGAGETPCTILMVGARKHATEHLYPVDPAAAKYGSSVSEETASVEEAYAQIPQSALTTLGRLGLNPRESGSWLVKGGVISDGATE